MFNILGFYKFTQLKNLKNHKYLLQTSMIKNHVRGTIILANEGINGTIAGKKINLNKIKKKYLQYLKLKILIIKIILYLDFNLFIERELK